MKKMKKYLLLTLWMAWGFCSLQAQSVTVEATIDSLQILIGEQARIRLQVAMDAHQKVQFPVDQDTLVQGVEVLEPVKPDTQMLNGGKRAVITQEYVITSFDSALYYLPAMEVEVDGKRYASKTLALKVYSVPVDTLHPDQFFGPKEIMAAPFAWEDWYVAMACVLLFAPLLWLLLYLVKRIRDNQPIIRKVKVEPKLPPHQLAMQTIERIKQEKVWQQGESKEYYTQLTDVVRTYIKERFGFNAMEMTSTAIIDRLLKLQDREAIADVKELFLTADVVNFAKHLPLMNENDANLVSAIDFINQTKVEPDPNAKPEPTEITIIEQRPLRTKILLGTGIAALVVVLIGSIIYVGLQVYNYFA